MAEAIFGLLGVVVGAFITVLGDIFRHRREIENERREHVLTVCVEVLEDADQLHRSKPLSLYVKDAMRVYGRSGDLEPDPWERAEIRAKLNIRRLEIIQPELVKVAEKLLSASRASTRLSRPDALGEFISAVRKATDA